MLRYSNTAYMRLIGLRQSLRGLRARLPFNSVAKRMRKIFANGFGVTRLCDNTSIESGSTGKGVGLKFGSVVCVGRGVELTMTFAGEAVAEGVALRLALVAGASTKSGLPARYISPPTVNATRLSPIPHQPTTNR